MIYTPSRIPGAWVIDITPITDARGFFAMTWLPDELSERGMNPALAQCNLAFNHKRGTLRGMHFQKAPHAQAKIVRATRGALLDVIVDLRRRFADLQAVGCGRAHRRQPPHALHAGGHRARLHHADRRHRGLLPRLVAVGAEESESGVRWDDPAFAIEWPF